MKATGLTYALPDVSVVIVNYNGLHFMSQCLESLHAALIRYAYEIVVVDNASEDGSQAWLNSRDDIVYVPSSVNLGFTGGNNLGASKSRGKRLLFINNDTLVNTQLDFMVDLLDDQSVGIAACRLIYGDGRQQFSFGYDHTPLRVCLSWLGLEKKHKLPSIFRRLETNPDTYLKTHETVSWVSGACFMMRREVWEQIEGFDTRFFMYCEDVDLCCRVRQIGLKISYTEKCCVTHFEGAGKAWIGVAALKRTVRSYLLFTEKHYGAFSAMGVSLLLGSIFLSRAIAFYAQSFLRSPHSALRRDKSISFLTAATLLLGSFGKVSPEVNC